MQDSKLISILQSLNTREMRRFGLFLRSPYFNSNREIIELYDFLRPYYPQFPTKKIERKKVYKSLYPPRTWEDAKFRHLMSDFTKMAEQFIVLEAFQSKAYLPLHIQQEAFASRGLNKYLPAIADRAGKGLRQIQSKDAGYYLNHFLRELDDYHYVSTQRNTAIQQNLESLLENLDIYYIINKLKYTSEMINLSLILSATYEPLLLEEILDYLENHPHKNIPAIALYREILLTLTHKEEPAHYYRLRQLLREFGGEFSKEELNDMYIFARNFCAKKVNEGQLAFLDEMHSLHVELLDNGLLLNTGYITQWDFKNIVSIAVRLEKLEWVETFLKKYKKKLHPDVRENAYHYNLALFNYYKGHFDKTLSLLQDVEFTDVFYHLDSKSLLLKTYFETGSIEPLYSLMDTFYVYLRRNKLISDYNRQSYSNFLKYAKRLVRIIPNDTREIDKFIADLVQQSPVANKTWLLEQINRKKKK